MKSLFCTSRNLYWQFDDDGKPEPIVEICLSLLEKQVKLGGGLTEDTTYETVRFSLTSDGLTKLIVNLEMLREDLDAQSALVQPLKGEADDE